MSYRTQLNPDSNVLPGGAVLSWQGLGNSIMTNTCNKKISINLVNMGVFAKHNILLMPRGVFGDKSGLLPVDYVQNGVNRFTCNISLCKLISRGSRSKKKKQ